MNDNLSYTTVEGIKCFSLEEAKTYTDYPDRGFDLTDESGEDSFWVRSRYRLLKNIVYNHVAPMGKTRFLEIGCGTGGFIRQIVENKNLEITGSEIYLKGLLYAKKHLPDIDFIQFDVTQGLIGEEFDIIAAFDVLEHIENDITAISNMNRMLRRGGCLIITVPQYMFLWSRLDEMLKHKRRYSRRDLLTKLRTCGFDVDYYTSFVFVLFPLMLVSRMLDRGGSQSQSDEKVLERKVKFPGALNRIFDYIMRIDEALIKLGISLPFGGTLVAVAGKR
ncbi:class I SAM-dependent methyltransferase [Syntrophorhabdus aromaticivorans]|uniref:class I SAM-dependent methyltransferase n=1 Tax=Syntrophorhabdus aromaticivorans TaxID=328301 RepID=UPI00040C8343|nr:class I SAM-dependent methyltransferase [Syntrophorhabdus aromaticivorans]